MLACWVEDPNSKAFMKHLARVHDYLWVAEDGMRMQSFGSQNWDTSIALLGLSTSNLQEEIWDTLKKGHDYVKQSQVSCYFKKPLILLQIFINFNFVQNSIIMKIKDNPSGDFGKMY